MQKTTTSDQYSSSYGPEKFDAVMARFEAKTRRAITRSILVSFFKIYTDNCSLLYYLSSWELRRKKNSGIHFTIVNNAEVHVGVYGGAWCWCICVLWLWPRIFGGNVLCRHFPTQSTYRHPEIVSATSGLSGPKCQHLRVRPTCRRHVADMLQTSAAKLLGGTLPHCLCTFYHFWERVYLLDSHPPYICCHMPCLLFFDMAHVGSLYVYYDFLPPPGGVLIAPHFLGGSPLMISFSVTSHHCYWGDGPAILHPVMAMALLPFLSTHALMSTPSCGLFSLLHFIWGTTSNAYLKPWGTFFASFNDTTLMSTNMLVPSILLYTPTPVTNMKWHIILHCLCSCLPSFSMIFHSSSKSEPSASFHAGADMDWHPWCVWY